ncbi:hypothetical protein PN498_23870 [Oscillatoria sp. CS-180]|uniref:hypothetical protein n=1 Tax=Oscillatoria sp. CS-180 TaxID=3021720 RepID=UPI00232B7B5C|nr:hypothetical protein [Oscillatoria sp. CS-180]MDB9529052.1 hypothetical protein [Oscillatoria sp. CS-180]
MSAAEHQFSKMSSQSDSKPMAPPQRPSLLQPPARPQRPSSNRAESEAVTPPAPETTPAKPKVDSVDSNEAEAAIKPPEAVPSKSAFTNHPIAPPSEPMQYRAIGLIKGTYQPSEEQLNRGKILADDGAVIDSVLLGRITSLIKKHIDLQKSHLWVVYPLTRQALEESEQDDTNGSLHLQIVGIWEPETLGMPGENPNTGSSDNPDDLDEKIAEPTESLVDPEPVTILEADQEAATQAEDTDVAIATENATETLDIESPDVESPDPNDPDTAESAAVELPTPEIPSENYFSIRGEVLNYDEDKELILVKIVQGAKRNGKPPKAFKLNVFGKISGKTVGYFWELEIERQGENLVLTDSRAIGIVPPKKKKKGGRPSGPRRGRRPGGSAGRPKPAPTKDRPRIRPSAPVKSNPL